MKTHAAAFGVAMLIALVFGALGAFFVGGRSVTLDLGNVIGPTLAACFAAWLALKLGFLDRLRDQVRAEHVRRYVEGVVELYARQLASVANRMSTNATILLQLIHWSREGQEVGQERYDSFVARLDPLTELGPTSGIDLAVLLGSMHFFEITASFAGKARLFQERMCVRMVSELDNIRSYPPEKRSVALDRLQQEIDIIDELVVALGATVSSLVGFAAAFVRRLEEPTPLKHKDIPEELRKEITQVLASLKMLNERTELSGEA
jgi:hypothetical protein